MKTLKPLIFFVISLWAIAVVTYAAQVKADRLNGKVLVTPMAADTTCSSGSGSSGSTE